MAEVPPVVGMRHVVEEDARRRLRVGGGQRHLTARFRPHRPDMCLVAVPLGGCLPVIAHRHRQEMELDVGVVHTGARAQERRAFELVRGAEPGPRRHPLGADGALVDQVPVLVERDRLGAGLLDVKLQVILQVLADAGAVGDHLDPLPGQMCRGANAGQHQDFGRIDGGGGDDHLAIGADHLDLAAPVDLDAGGAPRLDHHAPGKTPQKLAIRPVQRGPQIGVCRRPAGALPDGHLHRAEAFLLLAVVIVGGLVPCLRARLDESTEQRVAQRPARHVQRAIGAPPRRVAAMAAIVPAFHPLVIGQHIGIGPAPRAAVVPVIEIARMAAHVDHAVDRGGAADHLAARAGEAAAPEMRLWVGAEAPIIEGHVHRVAQRRGHLDEGAGIRPAIFQHQNAVSAAF